MLKLEGLELRFEGGTAEHISQRPTSGGKASTISSKQKLASAIASSF